MHAVLTLPGRLPAPPPPPPHPPPTTTPLLQKARKVYLLLHKERDAEWRFLKG